MVFRKTKFVTVTHVYLLILPWGFFFGTYSNKGEPLAVFNEHLSCLRILAQIKRKRESNGICIQNSVCSSDFIQSDETGHWFPLRFIRSTKHIWDWDIEYLSNRHKTDSGNPTLMT